MRKKKFVVVVLGISVFLLFYKLKESPNYNECPFCDENKMNSQKVYENEIVALIYNYKPINRGHIIIFPKRHIEKFDEITDEEMIEIAKQVKRLSFASKNLLDTKDYILVQKNGRSVGQSVSHVHFHFVPQKEGTNPIFLFFRFLIMPFKPKLNTRNLQENVAMFSEELSIIIP